MSEEKQPSSSTDYAGFYPREPLSRPVPFWVKLTLVGVRRRSWARFCFWAMIAMFFVCIALLAFGWTYLTVLFRMLLALSIGYCVFGAWIYYAAANWVDQYGTWKG